MSYLLLARSKRSVPALHRANFIHLYFDIAWFGLLSGSTMAFVAVYAARQGATAFQLGLISAGPALVNLIVTLPIGRWLEKQPIGPAVFWSSVIHRIFYLLWILLPGLLAPQIQIWTLIGLILVMSIPGTALAVGFNALFADAVPPEWRGHVAGIRNALLAITLTASSLLCGLILDHFPFSKGYQLVFGLGFLGAALSSLHLRFVTPVHKGPPLAHSGQSLRDRAWPGMLRLIGDSLRPNVGLRFLSSVRRSHLLSPASLSNPFWKVITVLFAFHLAQYLPMPLFPLYFVEKLHLSDQQIGLGSALFYATVFIGSTRLGHLTQKMGNQRVTAMGAMLMTTYPGLIALSRGVESFLVASVLGGLGWSLLGGALSNYILEKISPEHRAAHLAWYNFALNAAILLGSVMGPLVAGHLGLSAALGLFAICRLFAALSIFRWG